MKDTNVGYGIVLVYVDDALMTMSNLVSVSNLSNNFRAAFA